MQDAVQNTTPYDQALYSPSFRDQPLCENRCEQTATDERLQTIANPSLTNADVQDSPIDDLRKQIRTLETASRNSDDEAIVSSGSSALDAILPANGFARGTLIEWIAQPHCQSHPSRPPQSSHSSRRPQNAIDGSGAMMLAFATAKEACRDGGVFVIMDQHRTFFPPAALAQGFRSRQLVIVQPKSKKDLDWSLHQALNCPAIAAVWAALDEIDEYAFRRFQLAAENSGCIGLLGRSVHAISQPSWSEMQLAVTPQSRNSILGNRIPANDQRPLSSRPTLQRHHKNFSANRFLQIELIRSRHGKCGGKVMLEIDSYRGDIRKAVSYLSPLQKAASSVDTELQNAETAQTPEPRQKSGLQKSSPNPNRDETQQANAMDTKHDDPQHDNAKKSVQAAKTHSMPLVSQLANPAVDRRKTRA